MLKYLEAFGFFFVIFLAFYLIFYRVFRKDYKKLEKGDYVKIFITRYDLNMRKTKYTTVLNIFAFNNAFILAFAATLAINIKGFVLKLLVSFIVVFALIYSLYEIAGHMLKRREKK